MLFAKRCSQLTAVRCRCWGVLLLTFICTTRLCAQSGTAWQLWIAPSVAVGGPAVVGGAGRTVYARPHLSVGTELSAGRLSAHDLVCTALDGPCDLRELSSFAAVSIDATAVLLPSDVSPYLRAGAGVWRGNNSDVGLSQKSHDGGRVHAGEIGMRIRRVELGVGALGLYGTVRGVVGVEMFVVRFRF